MIEYHNSDNSHILFCFVFFLRSELNHLEIVTSYLGAADA